MQTTQTGQSCFLLSVGISGIRSQGLHRWQPPGRRVVVTAAVRLGCRASYVSAQLPLLIRCYCLHTPHHLQHDLWHGHLFGRHYHDNPRWGQLLATHLKTVDTFLMLLILIRPQLFHTVNMFLFRAVSSFLNITVSVLSRSLMNTIVSICGWKAGEGWWFRGWDVGCLVADCGKLGKMFTYYSCWWSHLLNVISRAATAAPVTLAG